MKIMERGCTNRNDCRTVTHLSALTDTYIYQSNHTDVHTKNLRILSVLVEKALGVAATRLDDRVREEAAATVRRE